MTKKTLRVQVRRAYEAPEQGDGTRVLVDRLWPRGLAKARRSANLRTRNPSIPRSARGR